MAEAPTGGILLTGFEPFGGMDDNPTRLLMERLEGTPGLATAVLPVVYGGMAERVAELLDRHQPLGMLCFGVAARTDYVLIERLAWNRDESPQADEAGEVRDGVEIVEGGPSAYGCSVPVPTLLRTLAMAGVPVSFSDHAGGFVCNHLFYTARHLIDSRDQFTPMAFLHVPPLPRQVADQPARRGMSLDQLETGARAAADWLRRCVTAVSV